MKRDTRNWILAYIKEHTRVFGCAPTVRQIARACDLKSTSTVVYHLDILQAQGKLMRRRYKRRGITLTI